MATAADVRTVRENTNELTDASFQDDYIAALVDAGGVASASAAVWKRKASSYAELVDVSEAGASRKMSDLHKNALAMAAVYAADAGESATGIGRAKTHTIVRDS